MLLTDTERLKFAEYLEQDIKSSELILPQLEKLPGMAALVAKTRAEMEATRLVAKRLRNTTSDRIT